MHAVTNFLTIFSKNIYRNSIEKQFVKILIHITTLNSFLSQTSVYSTNLSSFVNGSDIPTASAQKNEKWKSLSGFCVKLYYVLLIHLIIHHLLSRLLELQTTQHGNNVKKSHKKCNLAWAKINGFYMELDWRAKWSLHCKAKGEIIKKGDAVLLIYHSWNKVQLYNFPPHLNHCVVARLLQSRNKKFCFTKLSSSEEKKKRRRRKSWGKNFFKSHFSRTTETTIK